MDPSDISNLSDQKLVGQSYHLVIEFALTASIIALVKQNRNLDAKEALEVAGNPSDLPDRNS